MSLTGTRILRLLALLQSRRHWSGGDLAERLEVSTRTLRRDVDRLRDLGYPVEARRGTDGGYQLAAGAVLPPLLLDDDEAVAVGVGLHSAIQAGSVTGIEDSSVRALGKVIRVMPARLRRRIDALADMTVPAPWQESADRVDAQVLVTLAQACRDGERLTFGYTSRDGEVATREVDPHRLVLMGRRWYLVAWDLVRADWRTFRVDRLRDPESTGRRSIPRVLPAGDAAEFVRAGIAAAPRRFEVDVVVEADADVVRARIGLRGALEGLGPGRCRLTTGSDSLDWVTLLLARTGAEFAVRGPPELVAHLRACGDRFGRAAARSS